MMKYLAVLVMVLVATVAYGFPDGTVVVASNTAIQVADPVVTQSTTNTNTTTNTQGNAQNTSNTVNERINVPSTYNYGMAPQMNLPWMNHQIPGQAWNTVGSLFEIRRWNTAMINNLSFKPTALYGQEINPALRIVKGDAIDILMNPPDAIDRALGRHQHVFYRGVAHAEEDGFHVMDCEATILREALMRNAKAVIIRTSSFTIKTRTKGKGVGIGASGIGQERMGGLGLNVPFGVSWATALGDGFACPFIQFDLVD